MPLNDLFYTKKKTGIFDSLLNLYVLFVLNLTFYLNKIIY